MKKIFLSYALCFLALVSFSQNISLETVVLESDTLKPVADALVAIDGTSLTEFTNENGEFIIWNIPQGKQIVTVTKKGYETKIFILAVEKGVPFTIGEITLDVNKKEKSRRKKLKKLNEKKDKAVIARRIKALKAKEAKLEKIRKKNNNNVVIDYSRNIKSNPTSLDTASTDENGVVGYSAIQEKYAKILGVEASEVDNTELYDLIDNWYPTNYLLGGATDDGIDCSSFTQLIFSKIYKKYIERTAQEQYESKFSDTFTKKGNLVEGDLLFFDKGDGESLAITHVGLYLKNDMFVHSTSRKNKKKGDNGVQISKLSESFWKKRLVCGARRIDE